MHGCMGADRCMVQIRVALPSSGSGGTVSDAAAVAAGPRSNCLMLLLRLVLVGLLLLNLLLV